MIRWLVKQEGGSTMREGYVSYISETKVLQYRKCDPHTGEEKWEDVPTVYPITEK